MCTSVTIVQLQPKSAETLCLNGPLTVQQLWCPQQQLVVAHYYWCCPLDYSGALVQIPNHSPVVRTWHFVTLPLWCKCRTGGEQGRRQFGDVSPASGHLLSLFEPTHLLIFHHCVFSNVSSNGRTGCICLAFLHCVFFKCVLNVGNLVMSHLLRTPALFV